ncbi:MAG: hypothetical protein AB1394_14490 [Bacteroidota bacterium]
MKKYVVTLSRDYKVIISAKNKEDAKELSEFFIGGERDLSNEKEKKEV